MVMYRQLLWVRGTVRRWDPVAGTNTLPLSQAQLQLLPPATSTLPTPK